MYTRRVPRDLAHIRATSDVPTALLSHASRGLSSHHSKSVLAARWQTTDGLASRIQSSNSENLVTSAKLSFGPSGPHGCGSSQSISEHTTSYPASKSARTKWVPSIPAAPVTAAHLRTDSLLSVGTEPQSSHSSGIGGGCGQRMIPLVAEELRIGERANRKHKITQSIADCSSAGTRERAGAVSVRVDDHAIRRTPWPRDRSALRRAPTRRDRPSHPREPPSARSQAARGCAKCRRNSDECRPVGTV